MYNIAFLIKESEQCMFVMPGRDNPSQQNVTSQSADAQKQTDIAALSLPHAPLASIHISRQLSHYCFSLPSSKQQQENGVTVSTEGFEVSKQCVMMAAP